MYISKFYGILEAVFVVVFASMKCVGDFWKTSCCIETLGLLVWYKKLLYKPTTKMCVFRYHILRLLRLF